MTTTASSSASVRAILAASALWTLACVAFAGWNVARDPMAARKQALDVRLGGISFFDDDLPEPDNAPLKGQRAVIIQKAALWKALVAPPVSAEAKPDLLERLKGVSVTRQQVTRGDSLNVKYRRSPDDKQGDWLSVGATVNGLTVKEIRPDAVVFSIQHNGKEYTAELPRK